MSNSSTPVFGLLAGGGALPATMAAAATAQGWPVHLVTFNGQPQPQGLPPVASTQQFALGQVGHILGHLRHNHVTHIALAGHLDKPSILSLKPDAMGLKLLARAVIRHDDALLRAVTTFLQDEGFKLVTVQDLAPELLAPSGQLTTLKPDAAEIEDIALARSTLAVLGDLDIGQACIVFHGAILGVEAVEGTDTLITRCAELRDGGKGGVLVKRAKDMQTDLADLPTIGPETIRLLAQHHYRGLCIQAGRTLLINKPEVLELATKNHLFLQSDA